MVENRADIVGRACLRVGAHVLWLIGRQIAPSIEGDATVAPSEVTHLWLPATMVAREFVHEDHGAAGAGFLVVEPHAVIGGGKGHVALPDSRSGPFGHAQRWRDYINPAARKPPSTFSVCPCTYRLSS